MTFLHSSIVLTMVSDMDGISQFIIVNVNNKKFAILARCSTLKSYYPLEDTNGH